MPEFPPQVPRRLVRVLRKLGYTAQKGKAGSARSFSNPRRSPNFVSFREPHPGQNIRQPILHEYLRKLFLTPDEFMQLLKDCWIGCAKEHRLIRTLDAVFP
jgi:predicted RNA binding protein YcfA (HicA-like mRNA interferase family)